MNKLIHIIWLVVLNLIIFLPSGNASTHKAHTPHTLHVRIHKASVGHYTIYKP